MQKNDAIKMQFGKNLVALREREGLTVAEVAAKLNINRTTYWNYEQGISIPNFEKLIELSKFFAVSVDTLLNSDVTEKLQDLIPVSLTIDGNRFDFEIERDDFNKIKANRKVLGIRVMSKDAK